MRVAYRIFAIVTALLFVSAPAAQALSDEQANIYNSGIYYFDTATGSGSGNCEIGSGSASGQAGNGMTAIAQQKFQQILTAAGSKYNVDPNFIASFYYAENSRTGDSTNNANSANPPPVTGDGKWREPPPPYGTGEAWKRNSLTASGPFQFIDSTWRIYGVDGNGDGSADVNDLTDAAFAAAKYLAALGGIVGASKDQLLKAAFGYNQSTIYGQSVLNTYELLSGGGQTGGGQTSVSTSSCGDASLGPVTIKKIGAFGTADGLMGHQPTMIGVHYTAGHEQTAQDVISSLSDPTGSKHCNQSCSVQLTVDPKGNVYQLTSRLDVKTENIINFNDADIGIEIMGPDEQALLNNDVQFKAVTALIAQLMQKYNIKMEQDFLNKAGVMGHMECDTWSNSNTGKTFSGQYSGESVNPTDGHQDPGATYMANLRNALGSQGS